MNIESFKRCQTIHFIGIGGIGISAIARMLLLEGKSVSGSDRAASVVTDELISAGATISFNQESSYIPADCDLVIYTVAIPPTNRELQDAQSRKINTLTYPQTLKLISQDKFTIAISGTHGKTTTTAMVAKVLMDEGFDPTVIVGSLIKKADGTTSNFIAGESKYLIVEADEYRKAFLNLSPQILVITNLDEDHLDFYKDLGDIQETFSTLVDTVPADGALITDIRNDHIVPVLSHAHCPVIDYTTITLTLNLAVPGEHNRQNARAAISVAKVLGIPESQAMVSLSTFTGVWRRFEYKGQTKKGALIYDDYAHNPQKVAAALSGARELFPDKKIIAVFQPHLFSRTKLLLDMFATSFADADEVFIAPIFPAREEYDPTISSEMVAKALRDQKVHARAFHDFESIVQELLSYSLTDKHILITIGAGEAYKVGEVILQKG